MKFKTITESIEKDILKHSIKEDDIDIELERLNDLPCKTRQDLMYKIRFAVLQAIRRKEEESR